MHRLCKQRTERQLSTDAGSVIKVQVVSQPRRSHGRPSTWLVPPSARRIGLHGFSFAARIPLKRAAPHADTRSGIDASWLAFRAADYAPRLRPSPRTAVANPATGVQDRGSSSSSSSYRHISYHGHHYRSGSVTPTGVSSWGSCECRPLGTGSSSAVFLTNGHERAGAVPCFGARECDAPCACSPRRDAARTSAWRKADNLLRYPRC